MRAGHFLCRLIGKVSAMKRLVAALAVVLGMVGSAAAYGPYVAYYNPVTAFYAPAPVQYVVARPVVAPAVVVAPQPAIAYYPPPSVVYQPATQIVTRRRPLLGGSVSRVSFGYAPVTFYP